VFKLISLAGIAALVAFIAFVVVNSQSSHAPARGTPAATRLPTLSRGTTAPSFTLPRLGGGSPVSLATAHGQPVMINFFASWCSNCRAELHAVAIFATDEATKMTVIGVDTSDPSPAEAEKLLSEAGATYSVGTDPKGQLADEYDITGIPMTYFIGQNGRVVGVAIGPQTIKSLDKWVARLTARSASS
jgi:cytochrome c biogenesis protein CcmG, thiol:disulfide interchange protein DsbE